jgi:hypothetical protein
MNSCLLPALLLGLKFSNKMKHREMLGVIVENADRYSNIRDIQKVHKKVIMSHAPLAAGL